MKTCQKCGVTGPFSPSARTKDGLNKICNDCAYVWIDKKCPQCLKPAAYYTRSDRPVCYCVDCLRDQSRKFRENNRDKLKSYKETWIEANPGKTAEYARNNYAKNIELARAERREYYSQNKDVMNERIRNNYYNNREERLIQIRAYHLANPDKARGWSAGRVDLMKRAAGSATDEQIAARIDLFDGMCAYCAEAEWEHLDHAIPIVKGGTNWPANLRPACAACNLSKNREAWIVVTFDPVGHVYDTYVEPHCDFVEIAEPTPRQRNAYLEMLHLGLFDDDMRPNPKKETLRRLGRRLNISRIRTYSYYDAYMRIDPEWAEEMRNDSAYGPDTEEGMARHHRWMLDYQRDAREYEIQKMQGLK